MVNFTMSAWGPESVAETEADPLEARANGLARRSPPAPPTPRNTTRKVVLLLPVAGLREVSNEGDHNGCAGF
jgi:hypothetical protein